MSCVYDCRPNWKWNLDDSRKAATLSILRLDCFIFCQFLKMLSSHTAVLLVVCFVAVGNEQEEVECGGSSWQLYDPFDTQRCGLGERSSPSNQRDRARVNSNELRQATSFDSPGVQLGPTERANKFSESDKGQTGWVFFATVYSCLIEAKKQHSVAALVQTHWLCGMTDFWHRPTPAITVCFWWNMTHFTNSPLHLASASFVS